MACNSIGKLFTVTSFGESDGPALGCVIDGCPPGLPLDTWDIQPDLVGLSSGGKCGRRDGKWLSDINELFA